MKTKDNKNVAEAASKISDLKIVGDCDLWQLLCKTFSDDEGWMKSTKAMEVPGAGCLVQVTTQQTDENGYDSVAEALTFVPFVHIEEDQNGGKKLEAGTVSLVQQLP